MAKLKLIIGTYNSEPPEDTAGWLEKKYQNSYKALFKGPLRIPLRIRDFLL